MIKESLAEKTPSSLHRLHPRNHPIHLNNPKQTTNIIRIPPTHTPILFIHLTPNFTKQIPPTTHNNNTNTTNYIHHINNHLNNNNLHQTQLHQQQHHNQQLQQTNKNKQAHIKTIKQKNKTIKTRHINQTTNKTTRETTLRRRRLILFFFLLYIIPNHIHIQFLILPPIQF